MSYNGLQLCRLRFLRWWASVELEGPSMTDKSQVVWCRCSFTHSRTSSSTTTWTGFICWIHIPIVEMAEPKRGGMSMNNWRSMARCQIPLDRQMSLADTFALIPFSPAMSQKTVNHNLFFLILHMYFKIVNDPQGHL